MKASVNSSFGVFECVVREDMCAHLDGTPIHPVYSTFWLGYHAEVAARRAIENHFEQGENAVGGELGLRHEAMCAVGDRVRIEARVVEVRGAIIRCTIEAFSSKRRIAIGHQTQIVMSQERIDKLVEEAYAGLTDDGGSGDGEAGA